MLIAGLASDSQSWQPIISEMSSYCHLILPDNRGVGRTSPQDSDISIQKIADDCISLIKSLNLRSVNLLGHSMGGFVAMDIAIRYPGYVDKLILAATSSFNSERNKSLFSDWVSYIESGMDIKLWFKNIFYWIFSMRFFGNKGAVDEAVRLAIEYPYPQSIQALKNQVNAISKFNCTNELTKINSKTLVISGKEDILFPTEASAGLVKAIKGASLTVIDNAAHSIHMEQPKAFIDSVMNFLNS
ncbi:MAG: alpha/beta hydrolase [Desulfobacterales bacterium]|nr:alpha/beta hydrolase [Desulfobacterales bacterium]MBF0396942.1 alpha/beta hydrolase [Desulfobacterales bacterium]